MLAAEHLCLFASPRADAASSARPLREAGFTLWAWEALEPQAAAPAEFDALVVIGSRAEFGEAGTAALVALLRHAWLQGATIGLFAGAADLLHAADIAPGAEPGQTAGLFIAEQAPAESAAQAMLDAVQAGPHLER